ncbi:MAG TPA: hypothetical protein VK191_16505, partial [Symbiobacteriaceae bacterium]|nr:hypothetical protein [Symbiobacteriaceae bacterium]
TLQLPPIQDGALILTRDLMPGTNWGELLTLYNGGQPLVISGAQQVTGPTSTTVTGTASFLNAPNLTVQAVFTDQAMLRFSLIGSTPGPNPWRFSRAFPDLPLFPGAKRDDGTPFLDTLRFANAAFILATADGTDAVGHAYTAGLNWAGDLFPQSLLGLLGTMMGGDQIVRLSGPIRLPKSGESALPLAPYTHPWEAGAVPGLDLQADLGLELTLPGTALKLQQTSLRIWAPPTQAWLQANPTFRPQIAITGLLSIDSAGVTAKVVAQAGPNLSGLSLSSRFENVTLTNLAKLADLAGGSDLFNSLPTELQAFGEALGGLTLEAAGVDFDTTLTPSSIWVQVGMPNLKATLIPGFDVASPSVNFSVTNPFGGGVRAIGTILGARVGLGGTQWDADFIYPGGTAWVRMLDSTAIPVKGLLSAAGLDLPGDLPDLAIGGASASLAMDGSWSLAASLADSPPWTLDLGPTPLTLSDLSVSLQHSPGANAGSFGGTLALGKNLTFRFAYTLPGTFKIRAELPSGKLSDLIEALTGSKPSVPDGFDLSFTQTWALIQQSGSSLTFQAATLIDSVALLALTVQKAGSWGFAVGFEIDGDFTTLPGLAALAPFVDFVGLQSVMLVLSSLQDPGLLFPDSAAFQAPALGNKQIKLPAGVGGLVQGFNLYASLSTTKSQAFQALAKWLKIKLDGSVAVTVAVGLPDPSQNSKLFLTVSQTLQDGITLNGQLGGLLVGGEVGAFLTGQLRATVQKQPLRFDLTTLIVPNGILVSGSMIGKVKFDPLPVQLGDVGLVVGIDWEGIPSLGLAATLEIEGFQASAALFFDSTDPAKSLVAGSMDGLTLRDVARIFASQQQLPKEVDDVLGAVGLKSLAAFTGAPSLATALQSRDLTAISTAFKAVGINLPASSDGVLLTDTKGGVYHLTDRTTMTHYRLQAGAKGVEVALLPQLYVAPETTMIGAIQFNQGFHVEGEIDLLLLKARVKALVNAKQGIAADVNVDPITIWDADFFALKAAQGSGGPLLSLSTFTQPTQKDPNLRPPHFLLNGMLHLLGLDLLSTYVSIDRKGFTFAVKGQVNTFLNLDLKGQIDGSPTLMLSGATVVGLDRPLDLGPLGKVGVKTDVKSSLDVGYKGGTASAKLKGSFDFAGVHGEIPPLTLDVKGKALVKIGDTLWEQVSAILQKALASADQWLTWVGNKVITGAGQTAAEVGKVLSNSYHLASEEIAKKTQKYLGYGIDGVTQALQGAGLAADQVVQVLGQVGYGATEIANSVAKFFKGASHVDTNFGHVDTPAGPHSDLPATHVDVPRSHVDTKQHLDVKKVKVAGVTITPHGDTKQHVDTTVTPHGDTNTPAVNTRIPPHGDTSSHVDVKV